MKLPGGASIVAKSITGKGSVPDGTATYKWDDFIIKGVEWPMTGIEFLRHYHRALYSVVNQLEKM